MTRNLEGFSAIVTGAGSGMGRAIALELAAQGARLVVTDIHQSTRPGNYDEEPSVDTDELIRRRGGEAVYLRADVTVAKDVEAAVALAVERYGRLDVMINNAGIFTSVATVVDQSEEDFDLTMNVNAKGVFLGCKYAVKQMMAQSTRADGARGQIVNIASIAAAVGLQAEPAYCASKGAALALTKQVAADFGPHHIRVNAILPGLIQTAMSRAPLSDEKIVEHLKQTNTFPRFGTVQDVALAAAFLVSDQAGYVQGTALAVDGGKLGIG
jgi:NAD(P)-dependent dehydrogenase (short-subunit alcohol dehydrogenase family)